MPENSANIAAVNALPDPGSIYAYALIGNIIIK